MDKVSIIVPIYNVGNYLFQCLMSIQKQTYQNIEVILVDDGSSDLSSYVAKRFSEQDERFIYHRKVNGGLSSARNAGLKLVTGNFVLFVDGDDMLEENCVEELIRVQKAFEVDIVLFPFTKFYGTQREECSIIPTEFPVDLAGYVHQRIFGLTNSQLDAPLTSERLNTAWGKLYLFEKIQNFTFTDTQIIGSEDVYYNAQVFSQHLSVAYCDNTRYLYRKDNENSLTTVYNEALIDCHHRLYRLMFDIIQEHSLDENFTESLDNRIILNLFPLIANIVNSKKNLRFKLVAIKELLTKKIYQERFRAFQFSRLPSIWRIFYRLCKYKMVFSLLCMVRVMYMVRSLQNGNK